MSEKKGGVKGNEQTCGKRACLRFYGFLNLIRFCFIADPGRRPRERMYS